MSTPIANNFFNQAAGEYGQDYPVNLGSPIFAPFAGVFSKESLGNVAWGNRAFVHGSNGLTFAAGHLGSFTRTAGEKVNAGDLIGYSGGPPSLHPDGTVQSSGPHVELQFITAAGKYLDPRQVPGISQLEQLIFGAAKAPAEAVGTAASSSASSAGAVDPFGPITTALGSFNDFIGRAVWLAVGIGLIFVGLLLLVFEDFESAGKQAAKFAAANPEVLAAAA